MALSSSKKLFGSLKRERKTAGSQPKLSISDPISSVTVTHVSYDAGTGSFSGLPLEWRKLVNDSFTEQEVTEGQQILMKILPNQQQVSHRTRDLLKRRIARGAFRILQRNTDDTNGSTTTSSSSSSSSSSGVSEPKRAAKVAGARYDPVSQTYVGLPDEWRALLPSDDDSRPLVYRPSRRARHRPTEHQLAQQRQKTLPSPPARASPQSPRLPRGQPLPKGQPVPAPDELLSAPATPPGLPKGLPLAAVSSSSGDAGDPFGAVLIEKKRRILEIEQRFLAESKKITIGDIVSPGNPNDLFSGFELCGEGASGSVWIAESAELGIDVAVKKMVLAEQSSSQILVNEVLLMANCAHPAIVSFYDAYLADGALWVAMEYIDGEDITDILAYAQTFNETHIATIARETLLALGHLHSQGIMHRDIKSDNLLVDIWSGAVKLTDFGFGARLSRDVPVRTSVVGTTFWMAPEVAMSIAYDSSADIWSLAAFVHELCNRHPPYIEEAPMRALFMICKDGLPPLDEPAKWSTQLTDFIRSASMMNPDDRPSAAELLSSPFIRDQSADISCLIPVVRETRRIKFNTHSIVVDSDDSDDSD